MYCLAYLRFDVFLRSRACVNNAMPHFTLTYARTLPLLTTLRTTATTTTRLHPYHHNSAAAVIMGRILADHRRASILAMPVSKFSGIFDVGE